MEAPKILRHPGLQPLYDSLQNEWRQQQYVAVILLVSGIGLLTYGALENQLLISFLSSLTACAAIFWLMRLSGSKPVSELYHLLLEEPHRIRWVYGQITERLPFGLSFSESAVVYLVLDDGEEISAALPAEKTKLVVKTLSRVLPDALIGYTEDRELEFRGEVTTRKFSWWNWDNERRI